MSYITETPIPVTSISITRENGVMHGLFQHEKDLTIEQEQTICLHIPLPNFLQNCALGLYSLNVIMYDHHQADISSTFETTIVASYRDYQNSQNNSSQNLFFGKSNQNGLSNPWSYFNYSEIEFTLQTDEKVKGFLCESVGPLITVIQDGELRQFKKENIMSYSFPQQRMLQYVNNIKSTTEESGIYIYVREKEDNNYYSSPASNLAKIVVSYKREINNYAVHNILHMKEDSVLDVTRYLLYHNTEMILSNVKISFENSQISIPILRNNQTAVIPLQSASIKYSLKSYMANFNSSGPRYYPATFLEIDNTSDLLLDGFQLTINNFAKRISIRTVVKPKEKVSVPIQLGRPLQINNEYYFVNETNFNIELSDGTKELILAPGERYLCDKLHYSSTFGCANQENPHPFLQKVSLEEIRWSELSGTPLFGKTSAISCDPFALMNAKASIPAATNLFGSPSANSSNPFGGNNIVSETTYPNPFDPHPTVTPTPTSPASFSFGATPNSNNSGGFGTTTASNSNSLFGTTTASNTSGGFGITAASNTSGGFGATPNSNNSGGFGSTTPYFGTTTNSFGGPSKSVLNSGGSSVYVNSFGGGFGTTTSNVNSFGFRTTAASNTSGGFGATPNSNNSGGFGSTTPYFGTTTNSFGGPGKSANVFGTTTSNVNSSGFISSPVAKNLFGSPSVENNNTNAGESNPFADQLFGYPASSNSQSNASPPLGFDEPPVPTIDESSEPMQQSTESPPTSPTSNTLTQNNSSSNTNSTDQGAPSRSTKEESNPTGSPK